MRKLRLGAGMCLIGIKVWEVRTFERI